MVANYWDRGIDMVPVMTGAASVMDCSDLRDALNGLEISPLLGNVLDVGCGTGRLSIFCADYHGVDISIDAIEYCKRVGLRANHIKGPSSLIMFPSYDLVCCMSVFTHISRAERLAYLGEFRHLAPYLIVDIIPGKEGGSVALWQADADQFETDLEESGFSVENVYDRVSPDGVTHRYYYCGDDNG